MKNIYVRAEEYEDKVVFLHKVEEGRANESYGIHVAKLADLPEELIERAKVILNELESKGTDTAAAPLEQLTFFEEPANNKKIERKPKEEAVLNELKEMNLLEMTPLDAMNVLYKLQKKMN